MPDTTRTPRDPPPRGRNRPSCRLKAGTPKPPVLDSPRRDELLVWTGVGIVCAVLALFLPHARGLFPLPYPDRDRVHVPPPRPRIVPLEHGGTALPQRLGTSMERQCTPGAPDALLHPPDGLLPQAALQPPLADARRRRRWNPPVRGNRLRSVRSEGGARRQRRPRRSGGGRLQRFRRAQHRLLVLCRLSRMPHRMRRPRGRVRDGRTGPSSQGERQADPREGALPAGQAIRPAVDLVRDRLRLDRGRDPRTPLTLHPAGHVPGDDLQGQRRCADRPARHERAEPDG